VISVLDFEQEGPFIADIMPQNYALFKAFVMRLHASSGILWLTKACQIQCTEPQYAQIIGLARTLRNELALDIATLELDRDVGNAETVRAICQVYRKFQHRRKDGDIDPEYEYAFANGSLQIPRFHWISVADELAISPSEDTTPMRLEIGKRGSLKGLQWVPQTPHVELAGNEVVVQVQAVGMNFKDVLMSMGIIEGAKVEANGLGCECTGVIKQIGPDVPDLMVGDRVCVAAPHTYTTLLSTTSDHCATMPDDLSFEDGATMPCVYGTVIHGLLDLARLERGQTVLIHSACGGIGIAAINICRMIGAKIYATVGSEEKVEYLKRAFHLPRERIFNSRDSSFLTGIMRETGGKGVDVALNSLSGDLLHATVSCVNPDGELTDAIYSGNVSRSLAAWLRSGSAISLAKADLRWMCSSQIVPFLVSI
jgi:NADPH:quinone reductase-like Zn-dependent oxidoreductase